MSPPLEPKYIYLLSCVSRGYLVSRRGAGALPKHLCAALPECYGKRGNRDKRGSICTYSRSLLDGSCPRRVPGFALLTLLSEGNKPSALPRPRRRTLAGRSQTPRADDTRQNAGYQAESLMLTKLSPELRLMVWEEALGGFRLHIIQRSHRRLGHVICPLSESCEICRGGLPQPVRDGEAPSEWNLLSLPMTCKQM